MENKIDISNFVNVLTIQSVTAKIVNNFIKKRKELKLSRKKMSIRSGVSYGSIRRFEQSGNISLSSLLKLANVTNNLEDFIQIFEKKQ